jgi:tetratricopeptide (TPR) repeat protein
MTRLFEPGNIPPPGTRAPRRGIHLEQKSHCHRLSRFPDRYNPKPAALQDGPNDLTPFATNYFKQNPEAQILTSPENKLEELNNLLAGSASTPQRFTFLTQKKSMVYLLFGDQSPQMFECLKLLGIFYSDNDRPESAIRHFQQAQKIEEGVEMGEEESNEVSLLLAEAHLRIDTKQKQHLSAAEAAIERFGNEEPDDPFIKTRLALVRGRILKEKGEFQAASNHYETALEGLTQRDEQSAKVYVESAEVYESLKMYGAAADRFRTSREIFVELGLNDVVAGLDDKITLMERLADDELEQPLEEEDQHE